MSQQFWDNVSAFYKLMNLCEDKKLKEYEVRLMFPIAMSSVIKSESTKGYDSDDVFFTSQEHATRLFNDLDQDRDGIISLEEFQESYRRLLSQHLEEEVLYLDIFRSVTALLQFHQKSNEHRDATLKKLMTELWPLLVEISSSTSSKSTSKENLEDTLETIRQMENEHHHDSSNYKLSITALPALTCLEPQNMYSYHSIISDDSKLSSSSATINISNPVCRKVIEVAFQTLYTIPQFQDIKTPEEFISTLLDCVKHTVKLDFDNSLTSWHFLELGCFVCKAITNSAYLDEFPNDITTASTWLAQTIPKFSYEGCTEDTLNTITPSVPSIHKRLSILESIKRRFGGPKGSLDRSFLQSFGQRGNTANPMDSFNYSKYAKGSHPSNAPFPSQSNNFHHTTGAPVRPNPLSFMKEAEQAPVASAPQRHSSRASSNQPSDAPKKYVPSLPKINHEGDEF